jgi:hypothetical protein
MPSKWRWRRLASGTSVALAVLLIVLGSMLTGCARNTVVSEYCLIAEPVYFSEADSAETIRQIIRENSKYDELC